MAGVATACLKWVDVLENQFDKSFVDMDVLYNELDEDEDIQIGILCRKHASSLASCFSQLVHKATVIFQNNAKLEAQLLHFREELVQFEETQKKLVTEKNYLTQALVTALAENHLLKHALPDSETSAPNSDETAGESLDENSASNASTNINTNTSSASLTIKDPPLDKQEIQRNLELRMQSDLEINNCDQNYSYVMKSLQSKNEELRVEVLELESELIGARLDNVYLDKELAGRIQQIQILASGTPAGVKERLWTQIEAEMCLQRSKTIAQICKSKQTLRSKQIEDGGNLDSEQSKHSEGSEHHRKYSEASSDLNGEDQHYSKGKQVTVLKNPADDLGMAIIGGSDHNLPIIISEVFPNSAVCRSNKIQAGDIILSANEQDFSSLTHQEAVKFLSSLRGQIYFQLMASETVCEDDPSNLNFRFYRIFDADHTLASPAKQSTQQKNHPGKAVPDYDVAQGSRGVVKPLDLEAAASNQHHRVKVSPTAMSPVHNKAASPQKRSVTPQVSTKEIVNDDNNIINDKVGGMSGSVVELHEEDGSVAHV